MTNKSRKNPIRLLLPLFAALALSLVEGRAFAADTGQFLFQNAAPLPVAAGETIHFQVIAVNQGSDVWETNKTFLEVEVYDANKGYLAKSDRLRPQTNIASGNTITADISFSVPLNYAGSYFYRVFLVHNDQRIIQGDYQTFPVVGKPQLPKGPQPVTASGNILVSYREDSGPSKDLVETNASAAGQMLGRPYDFNVSAFHQGDGVLDLRSILFNYHAKSADVGLGDVSPNFSPLSVSGSGVRGALIKSKEINLGSAKWVIDAVGAQSVAPHEGSATSDGTYQRVLFGTQSSFILSHGVTLRANVAESHDLTDSLKVQGPTLAPVENQTEGVSANWDGGHGLKLDADWQLSSFNANSRSTAPAVNDAAWRLGLGLTRPKWTLTTSVTRTGTNFVNLAAPGVAKDRLTYDLGLSERPLSWLIFNEALNQYRDNLNNDPAKVVTTQRQLTSGFVATLPTKTSVNGGYSLNRVYGTPRTTVNNKTEGFTFGVTQSLSNGSLNAGYSRSEFTDITGASSDLLTNTFTQNWNWTVNPRLNTTLGVNLSGTKNKKVGSMVRNRTLSASANGVLKPAKVFAQGFVSVTNTTDDNSASRSDRQDTNLNLELTWKPTTSLSFTVGGYRTDSHDAINGANSKIVNGMVLRAGYSF
jgi:hypothetical protein